mmetsp:Transcript_3079/g.4733  ORF Transcript_3079/g.4733 Transcript_3079/m.4733 type:complete len:337 (-) Transcript_3079:235-1245(-)
MNDFLYEAYFKCHSKTFLSSDCTLSEGDLVTVQSERGFDVGVINRNIPKSSPYFSITRSASKLRILSRLNESEKHRLQSKLSAENDALEKCRRICNDFGLHGVIALLKTEFQFDSRKITVMYQGVIEASNVNTFNNFQEFLRREFEADVCMERVTNGVQGVRELCKLESRYIYLSRLSPIYDENVHDPSLHSRPSRRNQCSPPPVGLTVSTPDPCSPGRNCPVPPRAPDYYSPVMDRRDYHAPCNTLSPVIKHHHKSGYSDIDYSTTSFQPQLGIPIISCRSFSTPSYSSHPVVSDCLPPQPCQSPYVVPPAVAGLISCPRPVFPEDHHHFQKMVL